MRIAVGNPEMARILTPALIEFKQAGRLALVEENRMQHLQVNSPRRTNLEGAYATLELAAGRGGAQESARE
jgi:hypothetical protein